MILTRKYITDYKNHLNTKDYSDCYNDDNLKRAKDLSWSESTVIVTNNYERYNINFELAYQYAKNHNLPMIVWKYFETNNQAYTDSLYEHRKQLYEIFVKDIPIYITENQNFDLGIANGTEGILESIVLSESNCFNDENNISTNRSIIENAQPGEITEIYIIPSCVNIKINKHTQNINLKVCSINDNSLIVPIGKDSNKTNFSFRQSIISYQQLAYDIGFSITYEKAAGKTLDKVILNINKPQGHLYRLVLNDLIVGLSRTKHSRNIKFISAIDNNSWKYIQSLETDPYIDLFLNGYDTYGFWKAEKCEEYQNTLE